MDHVAGGRGGLSVQLDLRLVDPAGNVLSELHRDNDPTTLQCAQLFQGALLAVAFSSAVKDTGGTSRSVSAGSAGTSPEIAFGTGTTPAAFTDYVIQTNAGTGSPASATVNAISSNTFTVTALWTNGTGSTVTVSELALYITVATYTFCITHDVFTGQSVANGVSASATLTFTWS